jgi:hypothetical protein
MERVALTSKALHSAGYDASRQVLEIEFASGRVYQYDDVPQSVFEWLLKTPSKGAYVARMVTDRYAYRDVTPASPEATQDLDAALRASLRPPSDD